MKNIESAIRLHYDRVADRHQHLKQSSDPIISRLALSPSMKILDVGCGTGDLTFNLIQKCMCKRVIGLDFSNGVLEIARKTASKMRLKNVEFIQATALNLPFESNEFDVVVSNNVFHLFENQKQAFAEVIRVLKPGCKAVVSFKGGDELWPEIMNILKESWQSTLPDRRLPKMFHIRNSLTIGRWLVELGIDNFDILWQRDVVKRNKHRFAIWLEQKFELVAGFWKELVDPKTADEIQNLMTKKIMSVLERDDLFNITSNTLWIDFVKQ